jgi:hypothetical protein
MSTNPKPTDSAPRPTAPKSPTSPAPGPTVPQSPTPPAPGPTTHGRKFKHRELALADGGKLVLKADGSISQVDAAGAATQTWETADPAWASHAIRFGLFPQDATVAPTGRFIEGMRPPRR